MRCRLPHHIDATTPPPTPAAPTPSGRDSHPHVPPDQRRVSRRAGDHPSAHGSPGRFRAPDEVATPSRLPHRDAAPAFRRPDARPAPWGTADHDHVRRRLPRRLLQGRPGAHEASHAGHCLCHLSDREVLAELKGSRRSLERWLRHPVQWLAYPFGAYDGRVERLARRAGYVLAVTTEEGTLQSAGRPLALQRLRILDSTGVRGLAALLGDASVL